MDKEFIYIILVALIGILNGLILFLFNGLRTDVRDLRQNYFNALERVSELKIEVASLKNIIIGLEREFNRVTNKND